MYLFIAVDLQSWEKKIAEENEQEYDNEEDIEIEEKITVNHFSYIYITYYVATLQSYFLLLVQFLSKYMFRLFRKQVMNILICSKIVILQLVFLVNLMLENHLF